MQSFEFDPLIPRACDISGAVSDLERNFSDRSMNITTAASRAGAFQVTDAVCLIPAPAGKKQHPGVPGCC